jgi:hypothetical protein
MHSLVLSRLDEIAQIETRSNELLTEAAKLMEDFAIGTVDLLTLIERYGHSVAPNVGPVVAALLARRAQLPSQEMARLVLAFVARFQCWKPDEAVMNALTAVQHCLHYVDESAGEALRSLSHFFRQCLAYEGRLWVIIRGHALALLPIIIERDLVNAIFTPEEFLELREKIRELRRTAAAELGPELEDLKDTIEE